jgi:hypothetical protein
MKTFYVLLATMLVGLGMTGQILTTVPAFPSETDNIQITYNTSSGNGELGGAIPVYAHTGVITNLSNGPNDWRHVVGNWGTADPNVVMTPLGGGNHRITINPSTFYDLAVGETVTRLMFVFRNQNGTLVGRNADGSDIYVDIFQPGFNAAITSPGVTNQIVNANQNITITCSASLAADISLTLNGTEVASASEQTSLDYTFNQSAPGEYLLEMTAINGAETITDQVTLVIIPANNVAAAPAGTIDGINIVNSSTVRLQFFAPNKDFVFVIGDFNNWTFDLDYLMNRTPDGSTYWIEISDLDPNQEYSFQYYIGDDGMRVADIYAEKILSPWDDAWIPETTYPNLTPYPVGLTNQPVSVFKINEDSFSWSDQTFVRPPKERLVIYELLVRDFVAAQNFQTLTDTLDYIERLGINAIKIMPINEFEGNNSWGYNPSFYFAPDKYYGTPQALKAFVNECHNRGIAVIMDIALNHSFGQNPMVRMYFNPDAGQFGQPTAENPWFNQTPRHDFNVGYDFNHEQPRVRAFTKRVIQYWMDEYHIDGYRFDLSKGFTQNNTLGNIGAWNAYDQSRVNIWTDYYNHMQTVEPGSYVILEHLGDNPEETALANIGMMLWGKMTTQYAEAAMGYASDLSWGSYQARGWNNPHLISYAESHDEERVMFKTINFGNSTGSYDTQEFDIAIQRQELVHALLIPVPGPKMIWQFGELGYDFSINYCEDGTINETCRTAPKPIRWDYLDVEGRLRCYKVVSALNKLKLTQAIFSTTNFNMDTGGFGKRIHLNGSTQNAVIVGNTSVNQLSFIPGFQHTGTWYDYFTGESFQVNDLNASFTYAPGEYHVYLDYQLPTPDLTVGIEEVLTLAKQDLMVYPNPSNGMMNLSYKLANAGRVQLEVIDMQGRVAFRNDLGVQSSGVQTARIENRFDAGQYIIRVITPGGILTTTALITE